MRAIFDIEADGLLDTITKIHCLCYYDYDTKESSSLTSYQDIIDFVTQDDLTLIGHKIITYDIPALEKVLNIKIKARLIDTLALSWYLSPDRNKHGLEEWGQDFGIIKPGIADWSNLSIEEYLNRCGEDVKINTELFNYQITKLLKIYDNGNLDQFLDYLAFKLDCAREQEEIRWRLDTEKAKTVLDKLLIDKEARIKNLIEAMPENVKYGEVTKPNKLIIKDGSVSAQGEKWYYLLGKMGLSIDHNDPVTIEVLREPGNPNSVQQLKKWLFELGWIPQEFKYAKEPDPNNPERTINRQIPQISTQDDGICPSIKLLYEKEPRLENLEGLFIIKHRIGILEGWLENVSEDGYLKAEIAGLTNTLRFQHKILVNIPTIHKPYGKELRSCLIVPEGMILCGSDCTGLENSTMHHYMMYYDAAYVEEQRQPGYDPHLSIAVAGNMISNHEELFFKWYKKPREIIASQIPPISHKGITGLFFFQLIDLSKEDQKIIIEKITKVRWGAKRVGFGAVYGAGIPKLMLTSGMDKTTTTILYNGYWKKNWSVKKIANDTFHKEVDGEMWLYNPVSQFWYSLRYIKDKFSTLNQSSGVFAFDTWVRNVRRKGIKICGQFHDEIAFPLYPEEKELVSQKLTDAIEEANEQLNLNVKLSISIDMGLNYAETH